MAKPLQANSKYEDNFHLGILIKAVPVLFLLLLFLVISVTLLQAQTQSETITSSGTWTVPAGVTQITVEAWGGGGGGGNNSKGEPGGGGGAFSKSILTVISETDYPITVGSGGQPGVNGGVSSFGNLVVAVGGNSGNNGGQGGQWSPSNGQTGYNGGNGADAPGGGGSSAGISEHGNNASGRTGGIAPSGGGNGGSIPEGNNQDGENGSFPGGGGAGRSGPGNAGISGTGAPGQVIISWCEPPTITNQSGDRNITYGESAVFSISSNTTSVSYQWEVSEDNGNTWNPLAGEESSTLSFTHPSVSMSGNRYRCVVSTTDCGFT